MGRMLDPPAGLLPAEPGHRADRAGCNRPAAPRAVRAPPRPSARERRRSPRLQRVAERLEIGRAVVDGEDALRPEQARAAVARLQAGLRSSRAKRARIDGDVLLLADEGVGAGVERPQPRRASSPVSSRQGVPRSAAVEPEPAHDAQRRRCLAGRRRPRWRRDVAPRPGRSPSSPVAQPTMHRVPGPSRAARSSSRKVTLSSMTRIGGPARLGAPSRPARTARGAAPPRSPASYGLPTYSSAPRPEPADAIPAPRPRSRAAAPRPLARDGRCAQLTARARGRRHPAAARRA